MLRHSSHPKLKALEHIKGAWDIVSVWGRYSLNVRPVSARPITLQLNSPWNIGSLAWDMRKRNCKDDRDRVYALLSLTAAKRLMLISRILSFQTTLDRLSGLTTNSGGDSEDTTLSSMLGYRDGALAPGTSKDEDAIGLRQRKLYAVLGP